MLLRSAGAASIPARVRLARRIACAGDTRRPSGSGGPRCGDAVSLDLRRSGKAGCRAALPRRDDAGRDRRRHRLVSANRVQEIVSPASARDRAQSEVVGRSRFMIHQSSLTLERLSVGDLPAEASQAAAQHLSGCETCRAFLDELEGARDAFLREWPRERILARLEVSRIPLLRQKRWRWAGLVAAAACAAVALFFAARPEERIQLKGSAVTVHRKRADEVRILRADDRIRAGDALRVVLAMPRREQVSAWF